jgi:hypothetical protein
VAQVNAYYGGPETVDWQFDVAGTVIAAGRLSNPNGSGQQWQGRIVAYQWELIRSWTSHVGLYVYVGGYLFSESP